MPKQKLPKARKLCATPLEVRALGDQGEFVRVIRYRRSTNRPCPYNLSDLCWIAEDTPNRQARQMLRDMSRFYVRVTAIYDSLVDHPVPPALASWKITFTRHYPCLE